MAISDWLRETIAGGEQFGVEFKGPGRCEGRLRAQVVRAVLGFANRRDGGAVVIGVDAAPGRLDAPGVDEADLPTWESDLLQDAVAAYADPAVSITVTVEPLDGNRFVVIRVAEFDDVPVLCRRSYGDVLGEGALYLRGRRKPETTVVRTHADMRDLLELAIEKRLRAYVATAERARVDLTTEVADRDARAFTEQGADPVSDDIVAKVRSRGYWRFTIRPASFTPDRLPFDQLEGIVRRHAVSLRGWDFPHFEKSGLIYGSDFVGSKTDWAHHIETWRIYQSGQFVHLFAMDVDWAEQSWFGTEPGRPEGPVLGVTDAVWTVTEAFEFAARLATTPAGGDDRMVLSVEAGGLDGRLLYVDDRRRAPLSEDYRARISSYTSDCEVTRDELIATPDDFALEAIHDLFLRFGWRANRETLRSVQENLRRP